MKALDRHKPAFLSRSVVLLCTVLLAFQSVGWMVAWQAACLQARFVAQQVLAKKGTPQLESVFQNRYFQHLKTSPHEIMLEGQLFDFRILSEEGDSTRVALYQDCQEQALLSTLGQALSQGDVSQNAGMPGLVQWLAKWLSATFIVPEKPLLAQCEIEEPYAPLIGFHTLVAQFVPGIFAPPPESAQAYKGYLLIACRVRRFSSASTCVQG